MNRSIMNIGIPISAKDHSITLPLPSSLMTPDPIVARNLSVLMQAASKLQGKPYVPGPYLGPSLEANAHQFPNK